MPKGYSNKTGLPHNPPISQKGQHQPKHTREHNLKISLSGKGKKKPGTSLYLRNKKWWIKENNPSWKGGISLIGKKLDKQIRKCFLYRQWRSDIFMRDSYTCVLCGARSGNGMAVYLQADHYPKMFSVILKEYKIKTIEEALNCEELWNINNGRTLCINCHKKETFS